MKLFKTTMRYGGRQKLLLVCLIFCVLLIDRGSYGQIKYSFEKNKLLYTNQLTSRCFTGDINEVKYFFYFSSVPNTTEGYYWSEGMSSVRKLTSSVLDDSTVKIELQNLKGKTIGVLEGQLAKFNEIDEAIYSTDSIGFIGLYVQNGKKRRPLKLSSFVYEHTYSNSLTSKHTTIIKRKGKLKYSVQYPQVTSKNPAIPPADLNKTIYKYFSDVVDAHTSYFFNTSDIDLHSINVDISYIPKVFTNEYLSFFLCVEFMSSGETHPKQAFYSLNISLLERKGISLADLFQNRYTYKDSLVYYCNKYLRDVNNSQVSVDSNYLFDFEWSLQENNLLFLIDPKKANFNKIEPVFLPINQLKHLLNIDFINQLLTRKK